MKDQMKCLYKVQDTSLLQITEKLEAICENLALNKELFETIYYLLF